MFIYFFPFQDSSSSSKNSRVFAEQNDILHFSKRRGYELENFKHILNKAPFNLTSQVSKEKINAQSSWFMKVPTLLNINIHRSTRGGIYIL